MPNKPSQENCIAICKLCIDYLSENRCLQEKGLFRSSVSQTDVRALQSRIHQLVQTQDILAYDKMRLAKLRSEWEPNMIAEVLQTTFKDMKSPLLHEAYEAIISMELSEEDFLCNKQAVQKWICKLSEPLFSLASSFFRLIYNLARFEDSEPSLLQLSYCISPTICRPSSGAYMSIKHMEDLRRIRPIIAFIVENYEEVFTPDLKPTVAPASVKVSTAQSILTGKLSEKKVTASKRFTIESNFLGNSNSNRSGSDSDSERTSGGMVVDPPVVASTAQLQSGYSSSEAFIPTSNSAPSTPLLRSASLEDTGNTSHESIISRRSLSLITPLEFDSLSLDMDFESSHGASSYSNYNHTSSNSNVQARNQLNYSEMEWKILELLICSKVNTFLDIDERAEYKKRAVNDPGGVQAYAHATVGWAPVVSGQGAGTGGANGAETAYAEQNDDFSKKKRQHTAKDALQSQPSLAQQQQQQQQQYQQPHHHHLQQQQRNNLRNAYVGSSSRMKRRKMVVDCKALRAKIFEFEQDFVRAHNRVPKGADRGDMQDTYSRYRDLKRDIRDMAATDIQRAYRGFICRKRILRSFSHPAPVKPVLGSGSNSNTHSIRSSAHNLGHSSSMGNVNASSAAVVAAVAAAGPASRSGIPVDLHNRYRDLLFNKRDLKKRLKKFDEDFLEKWGRNPKKSDKESIRPMYQRYHEIKGGLEELKVEIESTYGSLPEDLMDDKESTVTGTLSSSNLAEGSVVSTNSNKSSSTVHSGSITHHPSNVVSSSSSSNMFDNNNNNNNVKAPTTSGANSRKAFPYSYSVSADSSDSDGNAPHTRGLSTDHNYLRRSNNRMVGSGDSALTVLSSDDEGGGGGGGVYPAAGPYFSNTAGTRTAASTPASTAVNNTTMSGFGKSTIAMNLDVLQAEKRSLHAHLKNYEREFNRTHGRPVMRQEDIQPVAHEYQRYKELKAAIKEGQSAFHQT